MKFKNYLTETTSNNSDFIRKEIKNLDLSDLENALPIGNSIESLNLENRIYDATVSYLENLIKDFNFKTANFTIENVARPSALGIKANDEIDELLRTVFKKTYIKIIEDQLDKM